MTAIFGYVEGETVYIGSDSLATQGWVTHPGTKKLHVVNGMVLGVSGRLAFVPMLLNLDGFSGMGDATTSDAFTSAWFALWPELVTLLDKHKLLAQTNSAADLDFSAMIAHRTGLYEITSDGLIMQITDICAIGSGYQLALGAMVALRDQPVDHETRHRLIANAYSRAVGCNADLTVYRVTSEGAITDGLKG